MLIQEFHTIFDLDRLLLEDVTNTNQRPKVEEYENYLFLSLRMLNYDEATKSLDSEQISLVLSKEYVISFQEKTGDVFGHIRERIEAPKGQIRSKKNDYLFYALIDSIVDNYFIAIENIELENEYRNLQVEGILAEKADALAQEVFDARDNLAAVAQANGLQLKTQKNVERRTYSGIASNQVIKNAAFSDELRDGTNSDLLAVTTEQAVFLRVVEYRDVRQKTLDEVKVGLRTALEQKTASAKAAELGLALQTEITTEEELKNKSEAAAYNFTSNTVMTRSQAGLQRDLLTAIFQAEKPAANAIVEQGVQINNGDYAVFLITEVKQADITALSESEKMANIRALADQSGFSEFNAYVSSLREKASIEIPKVKEEVLN